jgi:hypothetical protein
MKAYGGVDVQIHIFLTSTLVGGQWWAARPGRFTHRERAPGTHWIGGWVDPRPGLDDVKMRKFLTYRDSNSDPSVVQPVASRYTDNAIPVPWNACIETIILNNVHSPILEKQDTGGGGWGGFIWFRTETS